ncbi:MAG: P-II family nitrogen regulator [Methylotenera sp.]|nr:P-II family nitrogen regulator [Methylotenera sp.]
MALEKSMQFRKITAIIRSEALEKVEQRLQKLGVPGISVTRVKGYGEYANFYTHDWMATNARIEIFSTAKRAEEIARAIMEVANSGTPGDGIVAVLPVEKIYNIRKIAELQPDDL